MSNLDKSLNTFTRGCRMLYIGGWPKAWNIYSTTYLRFVDPTRPVLAGPFKTWQEATAAKDRMEGRN